MPLSGSTKARRYCDTRTCVAGSESRNGFACNTAKASPRRFSGSATRRGTTGRSSRSGLARRDPELPVRAPVPAPGPRAVAFRSARWPGKSNSRRPNHRPRRDCPRLLINHRVRWTDPNTPNAFARRSAPQIERPGWALSQLLAEAPDGDDAVEGPVHDLPFARTILPRRPD